MTRSIFIKNSKDTKEIIYEFEEIVSLISYFKAEDCWFLYKKGSKIISKLYPDGVLEDWHYSERMENACGLSCGKNSIFVSNEKGEVFGINTDYKDEYSILGGRGKKEVIHKARMSFQENTTNLYYDSIRDLLYMPFPKRRQIGVIDGRGNVEIEFGSSSKEFSIGSNSLCCGFVSPVSITNTKTGDIIIADKGGHSIWFFKGANGPHNLIGVYGSPISIGQQDGSLNKASFLNPSFVFSSENGIYVVDNNGKKIRVIDAISMKIDTVCESKSQITCLTTDISQNPCWIEIL